jgi:hypothetical protein
LRPLDDPRLDAALAQLDRKRHKAPGMMYANDKVRVRLNVTYQQKDVAKNLGASRWYGHNLHAAALSAQFRTIQVYPKDLPRGRW